MRLVQVIEVEVQKGYEPCRAQLQTVTEASARVSGIINVLECEGLVIDGMAVRKKTKTVKAYLGRRLGVRDGMPLRRPRISASMLSASRRCCSKDVVR